MKDLALLSDWIDQHKKQCPDELSAKQLAFAQSISERKQITIEPAALRSRAALST